MIGRAVTAFGTALLLSQVLTPPKRIDPKPGPVKTGPGMVSAVMAGADAQSFARALAEAGHTAGFITPSYERQNPLPPDPGHMLTLDEAIAAFTSKGTYRVTRDGERLVFRHVKAPADITAALEAPLIWPAGKQTFSAALFSTVLRSLARTRVGGAIGKEPGASAECPVEQTVTLAPGRASTIATLNHLVAQTKGVGWLVRFGAANERQRLQIGYVCGNGVWSALSVPGW
jgi:hypothetical protein